MEDKVILAGGCFWCTESAFQDVRGIIRIRAGYTGGVTPSPTYDEVCQGNTGHLEAVEIVFDPEEITFLQILELFWRQIDPTDSGGQFYDRGSQYRTAIFYSDFTQKQQAERSKEATERLLGKKVVTEILPVEPFFPAEEYHQNYCRKQPEHYKRYREGHQARLKELWGSVHAPSRDDLKESLTPLQYKVTQEAATEPPFHNAFWDNKKEGIYVDIVSGEPLFSSLDKFDSGTGWPCFVRPLKDESLVEEDDWKLGVKRVEVKSRLADSHLGHVFPDGPGPTHLRYCINSAALRFIPKEKLKEEGYEEYLALFDQGW